MKDMKETIGTRIAAGRKEKDLTQEALAYLLAVSPQAVSKWENDQTCPDIALLPKLAKILGISADVLLSGEEAEKPVVQILPPEQRKDIQEMCLRIVVESAEGDKVRVNLPMSVIQMALEMDVDMSEFNCGSDAMKDIDFKQILDLVKQGAVGNLVEIESAEGDKVLIFAE